MDSSIWTIPSLPTFSIALEINFPTVSSLLAEIVAICSSWSWEAISSEFLFKKSTIAMTPLSIPFVHNRQGLIRLVHVLAMCKVAATHFDVPCTYVNVKTWKQRVVGNGNATKKDIAYKAELIYGDRVSQFSQDALDALMVATYGFVLKSYKNKGINILQLKAYLKQK